MINDLIKYDKLFKNNIPNAIGNVKIFSKDDPWEINQDIKSILLEENEIWSRLYTNVNELVNQYASTEFLYGKRNLKLSPNHFPDLSKISNLIKSKTNWEVVTVAGFLDEYLFFELNGNCRFPSTDIIRQSIRFSEKYSENNIKNEFGYTPEPDIFHDVFGHMPFLMNKQYCGFIEEIGKLGLEILENKDGLSKQLVSHNLKRLQNFAWWTYEFGVMKKQPDSDKLRTKSNDIEYEIYGSGILSSFNEIVNIVECAKGNSSNSTFMPYNIEEIVLTRFDYSEIQDRYFVINSMEQLYKSFRENRHLFLFKG